MQPGHWPLHHGETRAGEFDAHVEIKAKRRANVNVVFRLEFKSHRCLSGRAPAPHLHIAMFIGANWNTFVRQIGHSQQQVLQLALQLLQACGRRLQLALQRRDLAHCGLGLGSARCAFGLKLPDRFAQGVAFALQLLRA